MHEFPNQTRGEKGDDRPVPALFVSGAAEHDGSGFVKISDAPGIGVALLPDAAQRYPYRKREILTRPHVDGSVVDQ